MLLLLQLPEPEEDIIERLVFPPHDDHYTDVSNHHHHENKGGTVPTIPVDILETQKEFHFFMDVRGLSKTDIQVTVEDDETLVIRSNGKRKHESSDNQAAGEENKLSSSNNDNNNIGKKKKRKLGDQDEEGGGCKYIRLERRAISPKFLRRFRLPENSNVSAVTAKCENGVLTVTVEKQKLPPPPKPKTVQVTIS